MKPQISNVVDPQTQMKKWTGGTLILTLPLLSLRYVLHPSLTQPTNNQHKTLAPNNPPPLPSVDLPGLGELFSITISPNLTRFDPNPNLIWAHMLPLLSRPDALPATADGVREASIAWKELVFGVEAEKDAIFGAGEETKKSPFSVSGGGSVVEIPSGLVQDSVVTIVGRNGSGWFGFELVGDGNGDGGEVPVVLKVNVSVGGDKVVVGQSSWRPESGWGEWEWCPGHGIGANNISNLKGICL